MSGRPNCLSFVCLLIELTTRASRKSAMITSPCVVGAILCKISRYSNIQTSRSILMFELPNPPSLNVGWHEWPHKSSWGVNIILLNSIKVHQWTKIQRLLPTIWFFQSCINYSIMADSQQKSTKLNYADEWWTGQWFIIPQEKPTKAGPFRFVQVTNDC